VLLCRARRPGWAALTGRSSDAYASGQLLENFLFSDSGVAATKHSDSRGYPITGPVVVTGAGVTGPTKTGGRRPGGTGIPLDGVG
jgi:hypothetical protein